LPAPEWLHDVVRGARPPSTACVATGRASCSNRLGAPRTA